MLNPQLNYTDLLNNEYKRYGRHLILKNIGINGQKRLKNAKILLIGAGGLGCPAIIYLASCGIGYLGIIDHDQIEESNLHRQILYNQTDINEFKVKSAKRKIHEINSLCKVNIYPYRLTYNNSIDIIKNYDIIIDASDNYDTRYIIDFTCYKLHKIHIYGAIQNFEGQMSVFNYKNGPRYIDIYPKSLNLKEQKCNELGVLGILPGIIGILQATEVIKIILGIGQILSGYFIIYNALNMSFKKVKIPHIIKQYYLQNTNIHPKTIKIKKTIPILNLNELINQKQYKLLLIDVRQNIEFQNSHIRNSINIPLKKFKQKNTIEFIKNNCLHKKNYYLLQPRISFNTCI
uniref:Probable molybdopterin-synthase adenylyltransferase n=1 Tax=Schimmelmannia schousboei TaxID=173468 RepID=A0A1C9C8Y4_9FLOR|nr:molybdopterin biosynthesis protein [Schimmelmannia schousboei]AOM64838.1 molybdopterin biosynthesis protein [Schimmelmannia schousboei]